MSKDFIGSNIALVIGTLALAAGLANPANNLLISGLIIILGTLAYKSAKKTKKGLVPKSTVRQILELLALVAILLIIVLQKDVINLIFNDPTTNFIIPLWVFIAYLIAASPKKGNKTRSAMGRRE